MYGQSFKVSKEVASPDFLLPIGKAKVEREGTDVTIVGHSRMVGLSLDVAEKLYKEQGIQCEVINLRSIRPLDIDTIKASVKKTNRYVLFLLSTASWSRRRLWERARAARRHEAARLAALPSASSLLPPRSLPPTTLPRSRARH